MHRSYSAVGFEDSIAKQHGSVFFPAAERLPPAEIGFVNSDHAGQDSLDTLGFSPDPLIHDEVIEVVQGQRRADARRAPSASASNFAHITVGCTSGA